MDGFLLGGGGLLMGPVLLVLKLLGPRTNLWWGMGLPWAGLICTNDQGSCA